MLSESAALIPAGTGLIAAGIERAIENFRRFWGMVVIYHIPNRLRGRVCNAVNVAQTANIQPVFERCLMVSYVNLRKVLGRCVHFVERRAFVVQRSTFFT